MNFNYSIGTIVRAVIALLVTASGSAAAAANGADVTQLDVGQWLTAIGLGLGAAGALLHRPKDAETVNDKAAASVQDVATKAIEAHKELTQTAVDSIQAVKDAVGDLTALAPAVALEPKLGPLAQQIISQIKTAL